MPLRREQLVAALVQQPVAISLMLVAVPIERHSMLANGRTVALRAQHIRRTNYTIDITSDGDTESWDAGYELETE